MQVLIGFVRSMIPNHVPRFLCQSPRNGAVVHHLGTSEQRKKPEVM